MSCSAIRNRRVAGGAKPADLAHFDRCPDCARFAERLTAVERELSRPPASFAPDAAFAARVLERLPNDRVGVLGRAALDLLPAAMALTVVLAGWCLLATPAPEALLEADSPTEDVVAWALESEESGG